MHAPLADWTVAHSSTCDPTYLHLQRLFAARIAIQGVQRHFSSLCAPLPRGTTASRVFVSSEQRVG